MLPGVSEPPPAPALPGPRTGTLNSRTWKTTWFDGDPPPATTWARPCNDPRLVRVEFDGPAPPWSSPPGPGPEFVQHRPGAADAAGRPRSMP